jgi:hypothetical protein
VFVDIGQRGLAWNGTGGAEWETSGIVIVNTDDTALRGLRIKHAVLRSRAVTTRVINKKKVKF